MVPTKISSTVAANEIIPMAFANNVYSKLKSKMGFRIIAFNFDTKLKKVK